MILFEFRIVLLHEVCIYLNHPKAYFSCEMPIASHEKRLFDIGNEHILR